MLLVTGYLPQLRKHFKKLTEFYQGAVAAQGAIHSEMFVDPNFILPVSPVVFNTEDDHRVCPICDPHDGVEYDFDDPEKPLPPLHPNCRCYYTYKDTNDKVFFDGSEWN